GRDPHLQRLVDEVGQAEHQEDEAGQSQERRCSDHPQCLAHLAGIFLQLGLGELDLSPDDVLQILDDAGNGVTETLTPRGGRLLRPSRRSVQRSAVFHEDAPWRGRRAYLKTFESTNPIPAAARSDSVGLRRMKFSRSSISWLESLSRR